MQGKVAMTLLRGDQERKSSCRDLEKSIQEFNFALSHFSHRIGFKTFQCVQGKLVSLTDQFFSEANLKLDILDAVSVLLEARPSDSNQFPVDGHFMVPYDRNELFTGRHGLLECLENMLHDVVPNQWNHRVALYGMGGVGKTQTALAYVYAHMASYKNIFWITATSEASLLSGFQEIAIRLQCPRVATNSNLETVAKFVLAWLRKLDNWLVVIDNLDSIELLKNYLPDRASRKHTLITTRNPNTQGIPARGLEVALPNLDESIEMLYNLSDLNSQSNRDEAWEVVEELGRLPLAIAQAAS